MMASDNIVDVTSADFEYQVIAYSQQVPVVVDFWAEWCIPCRTLGPLLEGMAREANGAFRLAKLNVDQNQELASRYNVRSIPAVKAFRKGRVVAEFLGLQPEPKVREFVAKITPSEFDLVIEKGQSLLQLEEWAQAEVTFRQVLEKAPLQSAALAGLAKSLLAQGKSGEALRIINKIPASPEYASAQTLLPLAMALERELVGDSWRDDALDAAYTRAMHLIARGNLPAAMDGILDILREDKHYRRDEARQVMVSLFEILGDEHPLTRQYRQELSAVLF